MPYFQTAWVFGDDDSPSLTSPSDSSEKVVFSKCWQFSEPVKTGSVGKYAMILNLKVTSSLSFLNVSRPSSPMKDSSSSSSPFCLDESGSLEEVESFKILSIVDPKLGQVKVCTYSR